MLTSSAKAKGRTLQKKVRDMLLTGTSLGPDDVQSRSMGAAGEDIILSDAARKIYPVSIECKAQERVNVWESFKQAETNAAKGGYHPVLVIARNRQKPLAVVDADFLFTIMWLTNRG